MQVGDACGLIDAIAALLQDHFPHRISTFLGISINCTYIFSHICSRWRNPTSGKTYHSLPNYWHKNRHRAAGMFQGH